MINVALFYYFSIVCFDMKPYIYFLLELHIMYYFILLCCSVQIHYVLDSIYIGMLFSSGFRCFYVRISIVYNAILSVTNATKLMEMLQSPLYIKGSYSLGFK